MYFFKVSALAGSGKTTACQDLVHEHALIGQKSIIAAPTLLCAGQIEKALIAQRGKKNYSITRIDSSNADHVGQAIAEHFRHAAESRYRDDGEILVVTQAGFMRCPFFFMSGRWNLYVDEIPPTQFLWSRNLPDTHQMITSLCELSEADGAYARVVPRAGCKAELARIAENKRRDEFWHLLQEVAGRIVSPHWRVYANVENWHRTLIGDVEPFAPHPVEGEVAKYPLRFFAELQPTMFQHEFRSVTIMGAMFDQSVLFKQWRAQGVEFREHPRINAKLAYTDKHPHTKPIRISYLLDGDWSNHKGDRAISDNDPQTWRQLVMDTAEALWPNQPYLYLTNLRHEQEARHHMPHGTALPHSPHGLNCYENIHNVIVPAAMLPTPSHVAFAHHRNLSQDELVEAQHRQAIYQAICRTSLRNRASTEPVHIVVPDKTQAQWLADYFDGAEVGPIGQPHQVWRGNRRHADKTSLSRVKALRERRQALKQGVDRVALDALFGGILSETVCNGILYTIKNPLHTDRDKIWVGTAFEFKEDNNIARYRQEPMPKRDFVARLRDLALDEVDKDKQVLLSPSYFIDRPDPDIEARRARGKGPRRRARHNVVCAGHVMLDFDGGHLSHHQFQQIFPHLDYVIYPTKSATDDKRFRVILFVDRPVTGEQYTHIVATIRDQIASHGFSHTPPKAGRSPRHPYHGLDRTKMTPENMMYLPSRPDQIEPYFVYHEGMPISVDAITSTNIKLPEPAPEPVATPPLPDPQSSQAVDAVTEAMDDYHRIPDGGGRYEGFFKLACRLYGCGLNALDVRMKLVEANTRQGNHHDASRIDDNVRNAQRYPIRPKPVAANDDDLRARMQQWRRAG